MTKVNAKFLVISLVVALMMFQAVGCKKANPEGREDVSGKVTLNGQAINPKFTAAISLIPSDGRPVTEGGGGQIVNGKYLLTNTEGVKPGKYKIKFFINQYYDVKTGEPATEQTGEYDMVHVAMVPSDFNDNSTIEFEVVAGKKNTFDYDIVTDYVPGKDAIPKKAKSKPVVQ